MGRLALLDKAVYKFRTHPAELFRAACLYHPHYRELPPSQVLLAYKEWTTQKDHTDWDWFTQDFALDCLAGRIPKTIETMTVEGGWLQYTLIRSLSQIEPKQCWRSACESQWKERDND